MPILRKLFSHSDERKLAQALYLEVVAKARNPWLYTECGLPDTLDGRFEAIALHLFLTNNTLKNKPDGQYLIRDLKEAFFEDMDRSIREMGVGDTGIGKRVKKMATALYGRLNAYADAGNDRETLKNALLRNAYATLESLPPPEAVDKLVEYMVQGAAVRGQDSGT